MAICRFKTGLTPYPRNLLLTDPKRRLCCGLFQLSLFVRFVLVFEHLIIFRIALWPTVGKDLPSWISACSIILNVVFNCFCCFLFGDWGRMWNSVVHVSVPDHCVFI